MDGITATAALRALSPAPQVVVLTTFQADEHVLPRYVPAPAASWSRTPHRTTSFPRSGCVAAGDAVVSPVRHAHPARPLRTKRGLGAAARCSQARGPQLTGNARLPPRSASGASNAEIASVFFMSEATVKAHVSRLLTKLGLNNRVQIAILVHDAEQAGHHA